MPRKRQLANTRIWARPYSATKRMRIKFWRTSRPPPMKRLGLQVCKWKQHKYLVDQITTLPSLLQTGANLSFSITSRKFQMVQMVIKLGAFHASEVPYVFD